MAAAEGEKICNNLEKDAKRPSAGGLGDISCNRGDCYCRGWLQLTEIMEAVLVKECSG